MANWVVVDYGAEFGPPTVLSIDALPAELRRALSRPNVDDDVPAPTIWLWRSGRDSPLEPLVLTRVGQLPYDESCYATVQWTVLSPDGETEYARFSTRIDGAS